MAQSGVPMRDYNLTPQDYMIKHDGKLDRWCAVQSDVEEYFRTTLEEVPLYILCLHAALPVAA